MAQGAGVRGHREEVFAAEGAETAEIKKGIYKTEKYRGGFWRHGFFRELGGVNISCMEGKSHD